MPGAVVPPVVAQTDAVSTSANETVYSFATRDIGAAATDRYVLVGFAAQSSGALTISSATIGGVTATVLETTSGTTVTGWVGAIVPTGATATVEITLSGSGASGAGIVVNTITGLDSVTPFDTLHATGADPTGTIDNAQNGIIMGVSINESGSTSCSWTGLATETVDSAVGGETKTYSAAHEQVTAGGTGRTITATWTGSSDGSMSVISMR